jgi:hypothetical protein
MLGIRVAANNFHIAADTLRRGITRMASMRFERWSMLGGNMLVRFFGEGVENNRRFTYKPALGVRSRYFVCNRKLVATNSAA